MSFTDLKRQRELKEEKEAVANYKPEDKVGTWWVRKEGNFTLATKYANNNAATFQRKRAPLVNNMFAGEIKKEVSLPEGVEAEIVSITRSSIEYELPEEVIWYGERSFEEGHSYFILVESSSGWRIIPVSFSSMGPANRIAKQLREDYPHIVVVKNIWGRYSPATLKPLEEKPGKEPSKEELPPITLAQLIERFGDMDIRDLGLKINYRILEND